MPEFGQSAASYAASFQLHWLFGVGNRMWFVFNVFFGLIASFAIATGVQIYLSKKQSKLPGLALPAITLLSSIGAFFFSPANAFPPPDWGAAVAAGVIQRRWVGLPTMPYGLYMFLILNITTVALLVIYFVLRRKLNRNKVEKMNIQDLE